MREIGLDFPSHQPARSAVSCTTTSASAIMIDMKESPAASPPSASDTPSAFPREGAEEALDSPRVTVWDVTSPDGWATPLHAHHRDTVVVFIEGGTVRLREADGTEDTMTHGVEDVVFIPAGTTHALSVVSGSPRAMFYDLKD